MLHEQIKANIDYGYLIGRDFLIDIKPQFKIN